MEKGKKQITLKNQRILFWAAWVLYFLSYMGRLNYSASMVEIGAAQSFTKAQIGLVSTLIFAFYGGGQLVSGLIGDHVSPRLMVFAGAAGSGAVNLLVGFSKSFTSLALLWSVNGLFQSLIWSALLRLFTIYLSGDTLRRGLANIQTSCAGGTCFTYVYVSAFIGLGWRFIFWSTSALLLTGAILWEVLIRRVERSAVSPLPASAGEMAPLSEPPAAPLSFKRFFLGSGILIFLVAVLSMGFLKEGVLIWMPEYVSDRFGLSSSFAIFVTALLPLVNLTGNYIGSFLCKKMKSEAAASGVIFLAAACCLGCLLLFGRYSLIFTLVFFSLITSAMTGINTALISFVPTYFYRYNKTSLSVGILNATTYLGSALAGWGIGSLADAFGWNVTQIVWMGIALAGMAFCFLATPIWKRFTAGEKE